jgi:hypothetical protein
MQAVALFLSLLLCIAVFAITGLVALVFAFITSLFMKGASRKQRLRTASVAAFPFALIAFVVSPVLLYRAYLDKISLPGTCILPNGYKMMLTDAESPASVYNPKNEFSPSSVQWQQDGVDGVRTIQVEGPFILGGRDSHGYAHKRGEVDSYFVLDTRNQKMSTASSYEQLRIQTDTLHVRLSLQPVYTAYKQYGLLSIAPLPPYGRLLFVAVVCVLLVHWFVQLRRLRRISCNRQQQGTLVPQQ